MLGTMLIDTNVTMSLLFRQNDYRATLELFDKISENGHKTVILDFSLYCVFINLHKRNLKEGVVKFIEYLGKRKNIKIYKLTSKEIAEMEKLKLNLTFDDSVHYFLAKSKNLTLISYDTDFDKTDLRRLTPAEALKELEPF